MKNILFKLICVIALVLGFKTSSSAQLVYIPDAKFKYYLNQLFSSCMVGDSIDPSCPAVLNAQYLDLNNRQISNLSGIEVFVNDTLLICNNNQLTTLPQLPPLIKQLICHNNNLTSLPPLPPSLSILKCDNNNLASLPILPSTLTLLNCKSNNLTSLPSLPSNLINLYCDYNQLNSLPLLPSTLTQIECQYNQISSIPPLPSSLTQFKCFYNQLTSLPSFPSTLTYLDCKQNQIISIPPLPNSLTYLDCSRNQMNSIPVLSSSLTILNCYYNQINSLPTLPNTLTDLNCLGNQLTSLPTLPSTLLDLECGGNLLTSLPILPPTLNDLGCGGNQLSSLPNLPATLIYLYCSENQLTSLPTLPSTLKFLFCTYNQLTSLPTLTSSLKVLYCWQNQLISLPILPDSLIEIMCSYNQLASLPSFPYSLTKLHCSYNPLTCLPDLKNISNLNFQNTLINCLPNYGNITIPPGANFYPLCDVFNSNACETFWNIEGKIFLDTDSNCNIGTNESLIKNQKINLYKNGILEQQTYSNFKGTFDFDTYSFNLYKIEFDTINSPFTIKCPTSTFHLKNISVSDSLHYDCNFGLDCKGIDLATTSIYANELRPGNISGIKIKAGDFNDIFGAHCAAGISGTVNITITGACNYFSPATGALTPNSIIGNVLTYNIADFGVLGYDSSFNFNILVDVSAALGSQICVQVSISSKEKELNYSNNFLSQCFTVVGSFDPNDKTAFPNSTLDISGDRWLTYLIRFQNTGTASAEHIFITDTLSASLDWSTFNLLSYSHQPLTQVYNDGLVKFSFPHINLPDSNTNEPASHGYVQYKIRAKDSLAIGSSIENTANIFFDFNAPVITNTTSNAVFNCSIPTTIITASICNGDYYSLNGVNYFLDGVYQQKLITSVGCDSIIELQLTVSSITNTISQSSAILQTTASGSGYQWIDCATNTAITSATNSTYQPSQSGDYAVAVTYGTCIDTSSCFSFSMVGLPSSIGADVIFQTRYNSNSDQIQLHAEKLNGNKGVLRLMDISGRIIFLKQIENIAAGNLDLEIPAKGMYVGIYLVNLITELDNISGKVVKY